MSMLEDNVKIEVKKIFEKLTNPVKLVVFTQESPIIMPTLECENCKDNRLLMEELAGLNEKISIEIFDFLKDKEKVEKYRIDKIPATVIEGDDDYGIRFFGIPAGYEFSTLIETITFVSQRDTGLNAQIKEKLKTITRPIHIRVFVTLTCPYCPQAAITAFKFAMENKLITAETINSQEFPHLAQKYNVFAVPKTIINETVQFEGSLPEAIFAEKIFSL
ncbi:MAG: thioredoxin family protein [candidate division WOR-3 bacterium]|nr:thioredoxin family protein [candidate division WOR-3 bacterium]